MLPLMSQMSKINARALQIMKSVCTLLTVCYMQIFSWNLILSPLFEAQIISSVQHRYSVHQSFNVYLATHKAKELHLVDFEE